MTVLYPKHAFNVAPGEPQLSPLTKFFRRTLRGVWRKQAVPAGLRPAAVLRAAGAATSLVGEPVLGDRMLSEVRTEYSGPPIYAVRPDGLILVSERNGIEVCTSPLAYEMAADPTASFPVIPDDGYPYPPLQEPVYGERSQCDVIKAERLAAECAAARTAGEKARDSYQPAKPELLERVLGGLRGMDVAG